MKIKRKKGQRSDKTRMMARAVVWERVDGDRSLDGDIELINRFAVEELKADQVYVRSMLLCSDQICQSDWLRFPTKELETIRQLTPGVSVLKGHDKGSLPLARFFKAKVVENGQNDPLSGDPIHRVRAWFYWLRDVAGADDLAKQIDGGIYREVSISWRYETEECSICGKGWYDCEHMPGQKYDGAVCYFDVKDVSHVLEGSLVYAGADEGSVTLARGLDGGESAEAFVRRTFEEAAPELLGRSLEDIRRILDELGNPECGDEGSGSEDGGSTDRSDGMNEEERENYLAERAEADRESYLLHIGSYLTEEVGINECGNA